MLNLLPTTQKQALAAHLLYEQIRQVSITVLSVGLVLSSVMIAGDRLLQMWYQDLSDEAKINVTETDRLLLEELVNAASSSSLAVTEIQTEFSHPLQSAQLLLQNTPSDSIKIHRLQYDYPTSELIIQGVAQDREKLVEYENILDDMPELSEINFPLSDLNQRDQINFTANATLVYETTAQ